jgi:hypothetical protein
MIELNSKSYFSILGVTAIVVILIAISFSTEFITSFSQNLVKTTGAVYLCLVFIYLFILLYRFMNKTKLILTLKEVLLTIVFLFTVYDVALFIDRLLVITNRDLDAIPSNIITYSIVLIFIVFQKFLLRHDV